MMWEEPLGTFQDFWAPLMMATGWFNQQPLQLQSVGLRSLWGNKWFPENCQKIQNTMHNSMWCFYLLFLLWGFVYCALFLLIFFEQLFCEKHWYIGSLHYHVAKSEFCYLSFSFSYFSNYFCGSLVLIAAPINSHLLRWMQQWQKPGSKLRRSARVCLWVCAWLCMCACETSWSICTCLRGILRQLSQPITIDPFRHVLIW